MNCPKCSKALSKQTKAIEDDGGMIIEFNCTKCSSKFEGFINPLDIEEVFEIDEEYTQ
jgi:hypothetical protein